MPSRLVSPGDSGAWEGSSGCSQGVWFWLPKSDSAHDLHQPQPRKAPSPRHGHVEQLHPWHPRRYQLLPAPERNPQHRGIQREKHPHVSGQLAGAGHNRSRIGAGGSQEFFITVLSAVQKNPPKPKKTQPTLNLDLWDILSRQGESQGRDVPGGGGGDPGGSLASPQS